MGRLRLIAFLEGLSLLVLLGIAMPLKYLAGQPAAVRYVGMTHGLLFVLYVLLVIQVAIGTGGPWAKRCWRWWFPCCPSALFGPKALFNHG